MNREILNRLTHKDIVKFDKQMHDCISVICQKAHPTTYHDCDADCPFIEVCDRIENAVDKLYEVYFEDR